MTIRILFFLALLSISFKIVAQETTTGKVPTTSNSNKGNVLIIPFEPRLYISDIDNQIARTNEMNYQDIKAKFRAALDQNIFINLKPYFSPLSFYTLTEEEARSELSYIYNSIGYKYEVLETEVEEEPNRKKLLNKFKKSKRSGDPELDSGTDDYIEAGIDNGQVVSQVDNREKYMKTVISNEELLPTLNKKYQAAYYIFINELDIKRGMESQYANTDKEQDRTIKVHYTIFNNKEEVASGAIITKFNGNESDINKIIKSQFGVIAEKIVGKIIPITN